MNKGYFVIYVRGNPNYGKNQFVSASAGNTVKDTATGLTWMQADNGAAISWEAALSFCESSTHADYDDWRLPDAHELQSIVDYTRSPETTSSAAIDSKFSVSSITNEAGEADFPVYWTSTTHQSQGANGGGKAAVYVCFGRGLGKMKK